MEQIEQIIMNKEDYINKLAEEFLPKFQVLPYGKYEKESLVEESYISYRNRNGIKYFFEQVENEVPDFSNKLEIVYHFVRNGLQRMDSAIAHKGDISLNLLQIPYLLRLKQEWQIKQLVPNLKEIIRSVVKEELKDKN